MQYLYVDSWIDVNLKNNTDDLIQYNNYMYTLSDVDVYLKNNTEDLNQYNNFTYKVKSQKYWTPGKIQKRKVPNQMAKSNDKTHQTNGQHLSYSWLSTGIWNVDNVYDLLSIMWIGFNEWLFFANLKIR